LELIGGGDQSIIAAPFRGAQPIPNVADLVARIGDIAPGTVVKIDILRNGRERTASVTLGEIPVSAWSRTSTR